MIVSSSVLGAAELVASPSFLIVNGGSHAGAGPTPLWGKRGGVVKKVCKEGRGFFHTQHVNGTPLRKHYRTLEMRHMQAGI